MVRKSNSHKFGRSISFDCRTQSNSIHGLSSIEFDFRTFDIAMPGKQYMDGPVVRKPLSTLVRQAKCIPRSGE